MKKELLYPFDANYILAKRKGSKENCWQRANVLSIKRLLF